MANPATSTGPLGTRPVYVQHDAALLARLVGAGHPCCQGVILPFPMPAPGAMEVFASFADGNPLAADWLLDLDIPGERIVAWSGTMSDELFGDDPRTWMPAGQEAFRQFCDSAAPTLLLRGRRLAFRPHARHVLSDVQSSLTFLRTRAGQPFEILLAPADLLTPALLADAEDHLTRAFEALGPRASGVLLQDAVVEGDRLRPVPLGEGLLPAAPLRALLDRCVPADTPIILSPARLDAQLRWLAG